MCVLGRMAEKFTDKHGAIPDYKGYNGLRGIICTSVDKEPVHGIPDVCVMQGELLLKQMKPAAAGLYLAWNKWPAKLTMTCSGSCR